VKVLATGCLTLLEDIHRISRPIRRTAIFSLGILEKDNDECILILDIYCEENGIVTYQN